MTIASKLQMLAAIKAAQYEAIIAKGGTLSPGDWSAYAAAIAALPTGGGIPAIISSMPFEIGDEPLTGTIWYVKPGGTGNQDGSSWDHAFATRQEAVNAASSGDQIRVWEGTYYLEQIQTPKASVSEYYGFNDDGSWATRQPFTHPSKLDAQFTANNFENTSVTFLDEQIIDGLWVQNAIKSGNGGGVYLNIRSYFRNCAITNCIGSSSTGGGVYANSSSSLTNCAITNCSGGSTGGGVYANSSSSLTNCAITNCSGGGNGGGVYANSSSLTNCAITNCSSGGNAGGVYVNSSSLTNCAITNCIGNTAGGGVYVNLSSSLTNCAITNCSGNTGGGVYANAGGRCYNVTCAMNTATTGDNFYLSNSQILYNCCSWGGNIWLNNANYAYKIYNCASNFALTGVTNWGTQADVQNFLQLIDFPFTSPGIAPYDGSGALYPAGTIGRTDEALAFINRFIAPKMMDCHLPSGSPLIGTGYYEEGVTPETDADGATRPIPPSIGAYEP